MSVAQRLDRCWPASENRTSTCFIGIDGNSDHTVATWVFGNGSLCGLSDWLFELVCDEIPYAFRAKLSREG